MPLAGITELICLSVGFEPEHFNAIYEIPRDFSLKKGRYSNGDFFTFTF
jgi:hypothetical protein